MQIERITTLQEFEALKNSWDATLQKSPANSIFLTHLWLSTWLQHYQATGELYVLVVREGSEIIGIAPLICRKREGFRRLATIGQETLDYENLIIPAGVEYEKVMQAFIEFLQADSSWDLLQFNRIPESTGTLGIFKQVVDETELRWSCQLAEVSPYIPIVQKWESYWLHLSKGFRANIRNRTRQLERDYTNVSFREVTCLEEINQAVELLTKLHRQRRQHVDGVDGLFEDAHTRAFYFDLTRNLHQVTWLHIPYLSVNDETIAIQLNFMYAGTYYKKMPAFDMTFAKYGVGDLLNIRVLEQCFTQNLTTFDFLRGGESYKFKYKPSVKSLFALSLYAPTKRGWLAEQWFERTKPLLKSNKVIQNTVTKSKVFWIKSKTV